MPEPALQVTNLTDDKLKVVITWKATGAIAELDAEQLDLLIVALGLARAAIAPAVPVQFPAPTAPKPPLTHAHLLPSDHGPPVQAGCLLLVRSPAYGWLDYPISPEMCRLMVPFLQGDAESTAAPPGTSLQ
jgi:hypothetical protein